MLQQPTAALHFNWRPKRHRRPMLRRFQRSIPTAARRHFDHPSPAAAACNRLSSTFLLQESICKPTPTTIPRLLSSGLSHPHHTPAARILPATKKPRPPCVVTPISLCFPATTAGNLLNFSPPSSSLSTHIAGTRTRRQGGENVLIFCPTT